MFSTRFPSSKKASPFIASSLQRTSEQRTYATRRPERPPPKIKDPLLSPNATRYDVDGGKFTFIRRSPPTAPTPFSLTTNPASPLLTSPTLATSQASTSDGDGFSSLPPLLRKQPSGHRILSETEIDQVRRLRNKDPHTYTAGRLAKQFGCSSKFIACVAPLTKVVKQDRLKLRDTVHSQYRSAWGERKKLVYDIREKRKSFW